MVIAERVATTGPWGNWAGNQTVDGVEIVHPGDVAAVAEVVASATGAGRRVKALGSGHSFTGIGRPEEVAVALDGCARVRDLDPVSGRVVVEAGMTLHRLNLVLAAAGRALTNLGDIDVQTVAGAIATGTHGTGARFGGLATQVSGIELVTADGTVTWCDAGSDAALWGAARVNLGALGVVTAVALDTVPAFALHAEEGVVRLDELLRRFDELADGYDHFEAYWFPHTGMCSTKRNTRVAAAGFDPPPGWRTWLDESFVQNTLFGATIGLGRRVPGLIPSVNRVSARALGNRSYTDASYRVFATPRRVRFEEMEYAVPREAATEVIAAVTSAVEATGEPVAFPVELRVAAADDITLSTAGGRASAYVAVHVPAGADPAAVRRHERYFSLVAGIMDDAGGRPHWGKLHRLDAAALRTRYPRFDEFTAVRARLDPSGTFANAELDRVLGPVGS